MAKNYKPRYAESHIEGLRFAAQNAKRGSYVSDETGNSKVGKARVVAVDTDANRPLGDHAKVPMAGAKPLPKV